MLVIPNSYLAYFNRACAAGLHLFVLCFFGIRYPYIAAPVTFCTEIYFNRQKE